MGLFDLFKNSRKKEYLLEWQKTIITGDVSELITTEKQLKEFTQQQAENDLRIIHDCTRLLEETLNPDVFFMRLDLLIEKAQHLCKLEKYISFSGASPVDALNEITNNYQQVINRFLIRYFSDTFDKAENMKTEKGKKGKYQKFYTSLKQYYEYMDETNIDYIETKYSAYVLNN